ncbi:hypothetical protein [Thauera chlorobenzoica]|uniref:hypothetical protein n=1 Tax=Thauera chlorobenzoica TaxID=96773 RepID=UPI00089F87E2|nr:hypothetical protein [Thauera chlorobenzoica]SEG30786.1 hypothetical protein SAMN05216242_1403 [Thauera chlorobenzoica]
MSKSLVRKIKLHNAVTIGDLSVAFEYYDRDEKEAMLVIVDYSKPRIRRLCAVRVRKGRRIEIAPGMEVELHGKATPKTIELAIFSEGLPVTPGWLYQRKLRLVAKGELAV